jgi:hypothetical protein
VDLGTAAAATANGYAAIWRAVENARQVAAETCFAALADSDEVVRNVTKHAIKHTVVPSELPEIDQQNHRRLTRSLLCWLNYNGNGWGARMAKIRNVLADMRTVGYEIMKLRRWLAAGNGAVQLIRTSVRKVARFSKNVLNNSRQEVNDGGEILHTYMEAGEQQEEDHTAADMEAIDQFIAFFQGIGNNLQNNATIDNFLEQGGNPQYKITRLLYLYQQLKRRLDLMTKRVLSECFETCIRAAMKNAFHLPGTAQGVQNIGADVAGGGLVDHMSVNDYSEQEATPVVQQVVLAGIGGNPADAEPLEEIPASPSQAATVLNRTFATGAEFTQFIRSLILVTNEGGRAAFQNLANGVIRDPAVNAEILDTPDLGEVSLRTVIKAAKQDLAPLVPQNENEYTIANRKITAVPYVASFYLDVAHEQ